MKKILLPLAAVALLASCSQNEVQEMAEMSKEKEIKFGTLNDKVTRAANEAGDPYQVYAKSFGLTASGTPTWFINDVLTPTAGGTGSVPAPGFGNYTGADKPSQTHYWPNVTNDWSIKFFAYAPATFGAGTATTVAPLYGSNTTLANIATDDAKVTITYTVPTKTGGATGDAQEDFTIATPVTATKTGTTLPDQNVHFQFKHMLTKISINCKLTDELDKAGYKVSYSGTDKPSLGVTNTSGTIDAAADTPAWANLSGSATTYRGADNYLILPQTSTGTTITLPVVITKDGVVVFEGDVVYTVKAGDITNGDGTDDDNQFLPGKNYGMNVEINGKSEDGGEDGKPIFGLEIKFSSEVADWGTPIKPSLPQPPVPPVTQP